MYRHAYPRYGQGHYHYHPGRISAHEGLPSNTRGPSLSSFNINLKNEVTEVESRLPEIGIEGVKEISPKHLYNTPWKVFISSLLTNNYLIKKVKETMLISLKYTIMSIVTGPFPS